jgi:hypothetical protein
MITIDHILTLPCPPETIFDFLANPLNEPKWNTDLISIRQTTPGQPERGSRFIAEYKQIGELDVTLTSLDRPKLIAYSGSNAKVSLFAEFRFRTTPNGTSVALRFDIEPKGILSLASSMIKEAFMKGLPAKEAALRRALGV